MPSAGGQVPRQTRGTGLGEGLGDGEAEARVVGHARDEGALAREIDGEHEWAPTMSEPRAESRARFAPRARRGCRVEAVQAYPAPCSGAAASSLPAPLCPACSVRTHGARRRRRCRRPSPEPRLPRLPLSFGAGRRHLGALRRRRGRRRAGPPAAGTAAQAQAAAQQDRRSGRLLDRSASSPRASRSSAATATSASSSARWGRSRTSPAA